MLFAFKCSIIVDLRNENFLRVKIRDISCLSKCDKMLNFETLKMEIPVLTGHPAIVVGNAVNYFYRMWYMTYLPTSGHKHNCQIILDFDAKK